MDMSSKERNLLILYQATEYVKSIVCLLHLNYYILSVFLFFNFLKVIVRWRFPQKVESYANQLL